MKKLILCLLSCVLCIAFLLCIAGCGGTASSTTEPKKTDGTDTSSTEPKTDPATDPVTDPATDPAVTTGAEVVNVRWILFNDVLTTECHVGAVPTPPSFPTNTENDYVTAAFTGWDKEIVAVASADEKPAYTAVYTETKKVGKLTFVVNGATVGETTANYGDAPTVPEATPHKSGFSQFVWVNLPEKVMGDLTVYGVFSNLDSQVVRDAYNCALIYYLDTDPGGVWNDSDGNALQAGSAMLLMTQLEYVDPQDSALANRVVEHIRNLISGPYAPFFCSQASWNYPIVTAALALAKRTPTIWGKLTENEVARVDTIMTAFTYIVAYNTDDDNNFMTGPRLIGNFKKTWNPNYRISNTLPIVFCADYFGGADAIDAMLAGFNEEAYNAILAKFQEYGFVKAYGAWTTPGGILTTDNVTPFASAKELLLYGTKNVSAYVVNGTYNAVYGEDGGTGVGVPSGGAYTYMGCRADDVAGILKCLIENCYNGGYVTSRFTQAGEDVAYILDLTESPVLDYFGMMTEFSGGDGSGVRSNATYCDDDFSMLCSAIETLRLMGKYTLEDHPDEFALSYIGNTDAVYKFVHGYVGFSLGKPRLYSAPSFQASLWIAVWNSRYGNIKIEETFPDIDKRASYPTGKWTVVITNLPKEWTTEEQFSTQFHTTRSITVTGLRWCLDTENPNTVFVPDLNSAFAYGSQFLSETTNVTVVWDESWNGVYDRAVMKTGTLSFTSTSNDDASGTMYILGKLFDVKHKNVFFIIDTTGVKLVDTTGYSSAWFHAWKADIKIIGNGKDNADFEISVSTAPFAKLSCGDSITCEMVDLRIVSTDAKTFYSENPMTLTMTNCYFESSGGVTVGLQRGKLVTDNVTIVNTCPNGGAALDLNYKNKADAQVFTLNNCELLALGDKGIALLLSTTKSVTKIGSITIQDCKINGNVMANFFGTTWPITYAGVNYFSVMPTDAAFVANSLGDNTFKASTTYADYPFETGSAN